MSLVIVQGKGPVLFNWARVAVYDSSLLAVHCVPHSGQEEVGQSAASIQGGASCRAGQCSHTFYPFESEREYSQTKFVPADQSL